MTQVACIPLSACTQDCCTLHGFTEVKNKLKPLRAWHMAGI